MRLWKLSKGMTVLELADLVKALEEEFGVSAAALWLSLPGLLLLMLRQKRSRLNLTLFLLVLMNQKIKVIKAVQGDHRSWTQRKPRKW